MSDDQWAGLFAVVGGLVIMASSGLITRIEMRRMGFMVSEQGRASSRALTVVVGIGLVVAGAAMILGFISAGGRPYPDGTPNRSPDYFFGVLMLLCGLGLVIFRDVAERSQTRYYSGFFRIAGSGAGQLLYQILIILMGVAWLAVGVAAFTGRIGGG